MRSFVFDDCQGHIRVDKTQQPHGGENISFVDEVVRAYGFGNHFVGGVCFCCARYNKIRMPAVDNGSANPDNVWDLGQVFSCEYKHFAERSVGCLEVSTMPFDGYSDCVFCENLFDELFFGIVFGEGIRIFGAFLNPVADFLLRYGILVCKDFPNQVGQSERKGCIASPNHLLRYVCRRVPEVLLS